MVIAACGSGAAHRGRTVVYASGADLQSVNPLLTVHPFAKQVERYVLLTTLVRYDSALVPRPYRARVDVVGRPEESHLPTAARRALGRRRAHDGPRRRVDPVGGERRGDRVSAPERFRGRGVRE